MPFPKTRQIFSSAVSADGDWVFVGDSSYKSIHWRLLESGGQIELRISNKLTLPAASDQEAPLFSPITSGAANAEGAIDVPQSMRWLRFRKTLAGGVPETTEALLHERVET